MLVMPLLSTVFDVQYASTGYLVSMAMVGNELDIQSASTGYVLSMPTLGSQMDIQHASTGYVLSMPALGNQTDIQHAATGYLVSMAMISSDAVVFSSGSKPLPFWSSLSNFKASGRALVGVPTLIAITHDAAGLVGEIAANGNTVSNSGSASGEFRWSGITPDFTAQVTASGAGVVVNHNLATQNHITLLQGDGAGYLGDVWVVRGSNTDTVFHTGTYTGILNVTLLKATHASLLAQYNYVINAAGKFISAAQDTLPTMVSNADTGGYLGDLYAVREFGGWRIKCSGSANVSCRIAILKL